VAFNHLSELIVPFLYFLPQPLASIGAVITVIFQATIFASGNLSWLNFLTMVLAIPAIDGRYLEALLPIRAPTLPSPSPVFNFFAISLAVLVAALSIQPIRNMLSPRQVMNTSYNRFHLVGTYGAFGGITRRRLEVVVEGTTDPVISPSTQWKEYEFKGKPTDIGRMPPQIAPYHLRLDWLMWFAAMSSYEDHPWFVSFTAKLLENDRPVLSLLKSNPFPTQPPKFVRAELYEYHFADKETHRRTGQWWVRRLVGPWFPAISLDNPSLGRVLQQQGWR
jgi:hypothetical protein